MMPQNTEMKKNRFIVILADIIMMLALVAGDQAAKAAAAGTLKGKEDIVLLKGVFQLHYLENRGAAFSMLEGRGWVFILAAVIMFAVISYVLCRVPLEKKYLMWHVSLTLIAAGGAGNLIDRLRLGYVIDFLYFSLINFPVFNVADICVTVGVALICLFILVVWKEEDMAFLSGAGKDS